MIHGGDVLLNPQGAAKLLDELGGEPRVSIAYDFVGESILSNYGFKKYVCCPFHHNGFVTGYEVRHLHATLVGDSEYRVVSVR